MGDANRCVQNLDKKKFLGKTLLMTKKFHIDQLKWFKNTSRLKTSHRKKIYSFTAPHHNAPENTTNLTFSTLT